MAARPPLVTVVIPTRNRVQQLREALQSVQNQSYKGWECVVVDDASTDGTAEWLRGVSDERVRSRVLERHCERSATRNAGLAVSKGSYVLFLDDDDLLAKGALLWLVRAALRHGSVATVGSSRRFKENGMSRRQMIHPRVPWTGDVRRETLFGWGTVPGTTLFARDAIERAGGWDESLRWYEDHELLIRVSALGMFTFVPQAVLFYRLRTFSIGAVAEQAEKMGVRRRYLATLPPEQSGPTAQIVEAGQAFDRAARAFQQLNLPHAEAELQRAVRLAPWVSRSLLLGPSVAALRGKLALGRYTTPKTIAAMRNIRARGRSLLQRDPDRPGEC